MTSGVRFLLVPLLGFGSLAAAQAPPNDESATSPPQMTVEKEGRSTRVTVATEIHTEIEIPAVTTAQCDATLAFEYTQRNTVARVEGSIDNPTCAVSSGDYTLVVRFKDEHGEVKTVDFSATWQRSDDRPVEFVADYPIGENVELVSVRSRRLRCVCADPPEQPP